MKVRVKISESENQWEWKRESERWCPRGIPRCKHSGCKIEWRRVSFLFFTFSLSSSSWIEEPSVFLFSDWRTKCLPLPSRECKNFSLPSSKYFAWYLMYSFLLSASSWCWCHDVLVLSWLKTQSGKEGRNLIGREWLKDCLLTFLSMRKMWLEESRRDVTWGKSRDLWLEYLLSLSFLRVSFLVSLLSFLVSLLSFLVSLLSFRVSFLLSSFLSCLLSCVIFWSVEVKGIWNERGEGRIRRWVSASLPGFHMSRGWHHWKVSELKSVLTEKCLSWKVDQESEAQSVFRCESIQCEHHQQLVSSFLPDQFLQQLTESVVYRWQQFSNIWSGEREREYKLQSEASNHTSCISCWYPLHFVHVVTY